MEEASPAGGGSPSSVDIYLLAIACAVGIASLYYNQPILPLIAASFDTGGQSASRLVMFGQIGYAIGLFLLVPIGDRFDGEN